MSESKSKGYRHATAKRTRGPNEEERQMMSDDDVRAEPVPMPPPVSNDSVPRLSWRRGEGISEDVLATPLYVQERIHPAAFIKGLTKGNGPTGDLFADFNNLPEDARYKWYQHEGNWSNRLIRGPSQEVMATLLAKDNLAGKVQCIYFDPPYGINFKSQYQASTRSKNESKGARSANAEQRLAFRDSYRNGVHSYLDTLFRIFGLARELLTDSGSFFMQISKVNVHRAALLLDEVFGKENHVATIMFAKSGGTPSSTLPEVNDYLLWYCKDEQAVKYYQLYEKLDRNGIAELFSSYAMIERPDRSERNLTDEEKDDANKIPDDCRLFSRVALTSQGWSTTGRSEPFVWKGQTFSCKSNKQWRVSKEGLERLAELQRLVSAKGSKSELKWKQYEDEVPGKRINNLWSQSMAPADMRYVVETSHAVIQRCILMTTDPSDLVLDLTCGSGTTPYVAEKFGRRWIACDVSGISLALSRHRLITSVFDWYVTQGSPEGQKLEEKLEGVPMSGDFDDDDPSTGFVYPRVPKVSAAILAYDEKVDPTLLVDQPHKSRTPGLRRVCSAFTVETHSPHRYLSLDEASHFQESEQVHLDVETRVIESIERDGVKTEHSEPLRYFNITRAYGEPRRAVTHYARSADSDDIDTCLAVFGPDDTVNSFAERRAVKEATNQEDIKTLLLIGFSFEMQERSERRGRLQVLRVQAHQDLRIRELANDADADSLVIVAEPDIKIEPAGEGRFTLEVKGYTSYKPTTGQISAQDGTDDIECMMVDTDYDGQAFRAREIHFPGQNNDKRLKRLKNKLGRQLDPTLWNTCMSAKTKPFDKPESGEVAVRIVTTAGQEISATARVVD